MDPAVMRRRVADARVGRLATVREDGRPHLVPCCFVLHGGETGRAETGQGGGDIVYSAVDAKPKSTLALRRLANLRANGQASLLVDHYDEDWSRLWWVRVDGRGRVVDGRAERDRALEALGAKYEQYRRAVPPGPVLAVDVDRWVGWP